MVHSIIIEVVKNKHNLDLEMYWKFDENSAVQYQDPKEFKDFVSNKLTLYDSGRKGKILYLFLLEMRTLNITQERDMRTGVKTKSLLYRVKSKLLQQDLISS